MRPRALEAWLDRARLALEIVRTLLSARRELAREPLDSALARLRAQSPSAATVSTSDPQECQHLARAVVRTLALMPGDTRCLVRSLVLTRVLARRGIPATLVIGTRTSPAFHAHAWVECGGRPLLAPGVGFRRLVEL